MGRTLSIFFKQIYADGQVRSTGVSCNNRPALLGVQLSNTARPLEFIIRNIPKLLPGYGSTNIDPQKLRDLISRAGLLLSDIVCYSPSKRSLTVLFGLYRSLSYWHEQALTRRAFAIVGQRPRNFRVYEQRLPGIERSVVRERLLPDCLPWSS